MSAKIAIVCSHCGSTDVRRDAYASWDVATQQWVLDNVFDQGYCVPCDDDDATLTERPASSAELA